MFASNWTNVFNELTLYASAHMVNFQVKSPNYFIAEAPFTQVLLNLRFKANV